MILESRSYKEVCNMIRFLGRNVLSNEIHCQLTELYADRILRTPYVRKWHREFKNGPNDIVMVRAPVSPAHQGHTNEVTAGNNLENCQTINCTSYCNNRIRMFSMCGVPKYNSYTRIFHMHHCTCGGMRRHSWLRHCATSRKVAGLIHDGVTGIFH